MQCCLYLPAGYTPSVLLGCVVWKCVGFDVYGLEQVFESAILGFYTTHFSTRPTKSLLVLVILRRFTRICIRRTVFMSQKRVQRLRRRNKCQVLVLNLHIYMYNSIEQSRFRKKKYVRLNVTKPIVPVEKHHENIPI